VRGDELTTRRITGSPLAVTRRLLEGLPLFCRQRLGAAPKSHWEPREAAATTEVPRRKPGSSGQTDPGRLAAAIGSRVLSDAEADEIRRGLAAGLRGPVLIKWCRLLLADRDERRARERTMRGSWPRPLAGPPS
jgi:hypothetical protein